MQLYPHNSKRIINQKGHKIPNPRIFPSNIHKITFYNVVAVTSQRYLHHNMAIILVNG